MNNLAQLEMFGFNGIYYRTQTGTDGNYQLANLPEGFYIVGLIRRSSTEHLWTGVKVTLKEGAVVYRGSEPPELVGRSMLCQQWLAVM